MTQRFHFGIYLEPNPNQPLRCHSNTMWRKTFFFNKTYFMKIETNILAAQMLMRGYRKLEKGGSIFLLRRDMIKKLAIKVNILEYV